MSSTKFFRGGYSIPKVIFAAVCVILMFFGHKFFTIDVLGTNGTQILCIFISTILLWLFCDTSWPSILAMLGLMMSPLYTANAVYTSSWGSWLIVYMVFTFMLAGALIKHGFLKRVATWFITRPVTKKNPYIFLTLFFVAAWLVASFMASAVSFIVFFAIGESIFSELGYKKGDKFPRQILFGLLVACSIGLGTTPISHAIVNLAFSLLDTNAGTSAPFVPYVAFGFVTGAIILFGMLLFMFFVLKMDVSRLRNLNVDNLDIEKSKMSKQEKLSVIVFFGVIALWLLPGLIKTTPFGSFLDTMGVAAPPILGAVIILNLKVKGEPVLTLKEGMNAVPWGAILLGAATMMLSAAVANPESGITAALTKLLAPVFPGMSSMAIIFIIVLIGILLTNFCSDSVVCTLLCTMCIPLAVSGILPISPAVIACIVGGAASLAWMTPGSTVQCAIGYASGWCETKWGIMYGLPVVAIAVIVYVFIGSPMLNAMI